MKKISFFIIISYLIISCVPLQKYQETESKLNSTSKELDLTKDQLEQLQVENNEIKQQIKKFENRIDALIKDSMAKSNDLYKIQNDYDMISRQLSDLQEAHELLLKGSAKESAKLLKQIQSSQDELKTKEQSLKNLEKTLEEKKRSLDLLTIELNKRDARLKELEKILFRKDSVVKALKNKVSSALLGYENEGLTVSIKNGKVYVSMEEKLLFASGSTVVDPKGKEALKKIASLLEKNPDINITVEGHTDNVPYKSKGDIYDNWDLSVLRSTSIIRIILQNSKIDPKRLTASGKGEYMPVAPNNTAESRAKNRRTEIILTPKLDELFKILEN